MKFCFVFLFSFYTIPGQLITLRHSKIIFIHTVFYEAFKVHFSALSFKVQRAEKFALCDVTKGGMILQI